MTPRFRRGLFWRVYLTLLVSLILVAVLGGVWEHSVMHGAQVARMMMGGRMGAPGPHIFVALLVVAATVALAAYPVVARITRRLERLRRSVEAWGEGETSRRALVDGRDEISAVAASFNAAADRAEALLTAHKTLLAQASHELRSPLARLRVASELFLHEPAQSLLATINDAIEELDGLVGEILLASRLDHEDDLGVLDRVDALALVAEEAARAGVWVRPVTLADFDVMGSPRLLRRLVRNLIENAAKHGAPPVEIELGHGAGVSGPTVAITVHDQGPGIDPALRDRIFEPFFRPAGWAEDAGSWGLGLALVRQIAVRHGGAVAYAPGPDGGSQFRVDLPKE